MDFNTGLEVQQRIHSFVGPELHLDRQGIWKAEQWAQSSGLHAVLAPGYIGQVGSNGVAAGIGLFSDASVGRSQHKGTGVEF